MTIVHDSEKAVQPVLFRSDYDTECGAEGRHYDPDFGWTHECWLEPGHEGDHFMVLKPDLRLYRLREPVPPRGRAM